MNSIKMGTFTLGWFPDYDDKMAIWLLGNRLENGNLWGDGALLVFPERWVIPLTFTEQSV